MKTSNKTSTIFIVAAFMAFSCSEKNNSEKGSAITEREYVAMASQKTSTENTLYQMMNEIDNNLKVIRANQGILTSTNLTSGIEKFSKKEEILSTLNEINLLLSQNKAKIDKLNGQLYSLKSEKRHWKKEAEELTKFIEERGLEMNALQQQIAEQQKTIASLNEKVSELNSENESASALASGHAQRLDLEIQNMKKELHKAYYAMGSYKELKQHNVVEKKGGVLGVGRTDELKSDFEKSYFTEIDTRQVITIPVTSKNAKLVTHHPVDSYEWEKANGNMEYLTIKDPDKFWAASKYLVVEVK
jgi:chromosome segregation ATPase